MYKILTTPKASTTKHCENMTLYYQVFSDLLYSADRSSGQKEEPGPDLWLTEGLFPEAAYQFQENTLSAIW